MPDTRRNTAITQRIATWFDNAQRDLPWRRRVNGHTRDPYRALVAEFMLQQTQVSRVIEKFNAFVERFPTAASLAAASEDDVLAMWSGLGYYRRARMLHRCAQDIVNRHGGKTPSSTTELESLPGVGRYTAGAISSIVFDQPEPIVDGNVARVLLRLDGEQIQPGLTSTAHWLWQRADELVKRADRADSASPSRFNEGLMELGAVICTPRSPKCDDCPVASLCRARRLGLIDSIPAPKPASKIATLHHDCIVIEDSRKRRRVQRRDDSGLWAGLWQPPSLERPARAASRREIESWIGAPVERIDAFDHTLSHRRVRFRVWRTTTRPATLPPGHWRTRRQIESLGVSNPHRRILLEM